MHGDFGSNAVTQRMQHRPQKYVRMLPVGFIHFPTQSLKPLVGLGDGAFDDTHLMSHGPHAARTPVDGVGSKVTVCLSASGFPETACAWGRTSLVIRGTSVVHLAQGTGHGNTASGPPSGGVPISQPARGGADFGGPRSDKLARWQRRHPISTLMAPAQEGECNQC